MLQHEIHDYYGNYKISPGLIELRNLVAVGRPDHPQRAGAP